jgi:hypothetical protein
MFPLYCSMLSPFVFFGFSALAYINPCTLHCSKESDIVPHRFAPRSHSHFVSIQPVHFGAPLQPSPITSLLLRTRLAPFAHPHTHTASAVVLFYFRHGQRSVSASTIFRSGGAEARGRPGSSSSGFGCSDSVGPVLFVGRSYTSLSSIDHPESAHI